MTMTSPARALAVFGTASDVGKSVIATALCRLASDRGVLVAPFKAQNMSNNSGVTREGAEMGRAQIVQALAARVEPHVDMNPVLLKPSSDRTSQVVLLGEPWANRDARTYYDGADVLSREALAALDRLRERHELIVIEGAGSCAEVNLRSRDFVNFRVAHAAGAPVLLVADIDRGGVFAQVVGTLAVLPDEDRDRVRGVLINRFRGDAALFHDGVEYLERRTGVPVLGVVPFLPDLDVDVEDGVALDGVVDPPVRARSSEDRTAWAAVIRLPHISNFTDFDPLSRHPGITLHYLSRPRDLSAYDWVILPGSKAVRDDLTWMHQVGWVREVSAFRDRGGRISGVCGGYQILGESIEDPAGVEGAPGRAKGLGLLGARTVFEATKVVTRVEGELLRGGARLRGYEIHMGRTERLGDAPFARLTSGSLSSSEESFDGAISADGRVFGSYVHGLFDSPDVVAALLTDFLGLPAHALVAPRSGLDALDRLAEHFAAHADVEAIFELAQGA